MSRTAAPGAAVAGVLKYFMLLLSFAVFYEVK